jgi:hypothetical protein
MYPINSKISVEWDDDVTIVRLNDQLILREEHIREIEESIMPLVEQARCPNLMLDFCRVKSLSSALTSRFTRTAILRGDFASLSPH